MERQVLINEIQRNIEDKENDILLLNSKLNKLKDCYEITKEDVLSNCDAYMKLEVKEMQDPMWYFNSPAPMIKYLNIDVLDGFYLSSEVEEVVKLYAKTILNLKFEE